MKYVCSCHEKCMKIGNDPGCQGHKPNNLKYAWDDISISNPYCCYGGNRVYPVEYFKIELPDELFEF
jgi:hypothetical protein